MSFFNPKEDVINVQLTSYGKVLLSKGKFIPKFYSFNDDEVIYDYEYCGLTESQNSIQERIKNSPRLETQAIFVGIETNVKKVNKAIRSNTIKFEDGETLFQTLDNAYSFPASLGNMSPLSEYSPSWGIYYYNGEITGSIEYLTGSHQLLRIPRLNTDIIYKTSIGHTNIPLEETENVIRPIDIDTNKIYSDGTFIEIEDDFVLMEIEEKNTIFTKDNFTIELFEINEREETKISGSLIELTPMKFVKKNKELPPEERGMFDEVDLDPSYTEYYVDFLVDEEIDESIFCNAKRRNEKRKNLFTDRMPINCQEIKENSEDVFDLPEDAVEGCD